MVGGVVVGGGLKLVCVVYLGGIDMVWFGLIGCGGCGIGVVI